MATNTSPSSDQLSLTALSGALEELPIRRSKKELTHKSAVQKAITIPEISEHILKHLPYDDLLRAKRINRHFATIIDTSPTLQRKLYPSPLAGSEEEEITRNLHPALTMVGTPSSAIYMLCRSRRPGDPKWYEVAVMTRKCCITTTPSDSVLHKMLICQPPVTKALLHIQRAARNKRSNLRTTFEIMVVYSDEGITFGQLFEVAKSRMPRRRDSEVSYFVKSIGLESAAEQDADLMEELK
jgi:hypothetical protein